MSNDYSKALSIWEHKLGEIEHKLRPEEDDNLEFLRLKKESQKKDDETLIYKGVKNLYVKMVLRSSPELTSEVQEGLKKWVGQNIVQITEDMMIAFKLVKLDDLNKLKEKLIEKEASKK